MKLLHGLIEKKDERATSGKLGLEGIKLTKLTEGDYIEAYLTMFERDPVSKPSK